MAGLWVLETNTSTWMQMLDGGPRRDRRQAVDGTGRAATAAREPRAATAARQPFEEVVELSVRHESWPPGVRLPTGCMCIYCGVREATGFLWARAGGAVCGPCGDLGGRGGLAPLDGLRVGRYVAWLGTLFGKSTWLVACAGIIAEHAIHLHRNGGNVFLVRPRRWAVLEGLPNISAHPSDQWNEMCLRHALARLSWRAALASLAGKWHIQLRRGVLRDPPDPRVLTEEDLADATGQLVNRARWYTRFLLGRWDLCEARGGPYPGPRAASMAEVQACAATAERVCRMSSWPLLQHRSGFLGRDACCVELRELHAHLHVLVLAAVREDPHLPGKEAVVSTVAAAEAAGFTETVRRAKETWLAQLDVDPFGGAPGNRLWCGCYFCSALDGSGPLPPWPPSSPRSRRNALVMAR